MIQKSNPADTKIVFFGNERLATGVSTDAPTLRQLIAAGYNVVAVISHNSGSHSRKQRPLEIASVAAEHNIPFLLPEKPAEVIEQMAAMQPQIGVLVAYGKIVPQSVIDIFPHGIINIHPSLLPLHRGPTPVESVILEGARETGVSVMQLVRAMDTGPAYGQVRVPLAGSETKQELATNLLHAGGELLVELLPTILDGTLEPTDQDDARATYDQLITKQSGLLDFTKPAELLEREVRAYLGWPGSKTVVGDKDVIITTARVEAGGGGTTGAIWRSGKQFGFYTSQGVLVIDKLKPAGKQEMTTEAFLAGYKL